MYVIYMEHTKIESPRNHIILLLSFSLQWYWLLENTLFHHILQLSTSMVYTPSCWRHTLIPVFLFITLYHTTDIPADTEPYDELAPVGAYYFLLIRIYFHLPYLRASSITPNYPCRLRRHSMLHIWGGIANNASIFLLSSTSASS